MTGTAGEVATRKAALRRRMKEVLAGLPAERRAAWSRGVCDALLESGLIGGAPTVLAYGAMGGEPDVSRLAEVVRRRGGRVCAPIVDWEAGTMRAGEVESLVPGAPGGLVRGRFGTPVAPDDAEVVPAWDVQVVLAPGLAFDCHGGRLGRGAGFYDRFLSGFAGLSVGVGFAVQLVDRVPMESGDERLGAVATEAGVTMVRG